MSQRTVGQLIKRQVVQMSGDATVRDACGLMSRNHIGALLVVAEGRLEGIFTERDALIRVLAAGRDPDTTTLSEVMSPNPVTLDPQTAATDALRLLGEIGFRHLPIVEDGEIHGIISLRDFVGVELRPEGPADLEGGN